MKTIAISILLTLSCFSVHSQLWVEDNAVWHYDFSNWSSVGFYKIEYMGDTVIGGHLVEDLSVTKSHFDHFTTPWGNDTLIYNGIWMMGHEYVYHTDDSLMRWDGEQFRLLLDFSAQVGDEWLIAVDTLPYDQTCSDSSFVKVIATGQENIDGIDYRTVTLEPTDSSAHYIYGTFNERYGGTGYFLPRPRDCFGGVTEWDIINFKCFEDDSLIYHPNGDYCEYYLSLYLALEEEELDSISLKPNPTSGIVHFEGVSIKKVEVISIHGKVVRKFELSSDQTIDLTNLKNGTYLILCTTIENQTVTRRLIKQ